MDIAVPPKTDEEIKTEEVVSVVANKPTEIPLTKTDEAGKPADKVQEKADLKDEAFAKEEADRNKTAELILSKQFFLPIREKRSKPLLTLALLPKKNKKQKRKTTKVAETSVKKKSNGTQTLLIIVLVAILIGALLAIDAGMIDIGVKLPFDFIKNV